MYCLEGSISWVLIKSDTDVTWMIYRYSSCGILWCHNGSFPPRWRLSNQLAEGLNTIYCSSCSLGDSLGLSVFVHRMKRTRELFEIPPDMSPAETGKHLSWLSGSLWDVWANLFHFSCGRPWHHCRCLLLGLCACTERVSFTLAASCWHGAASLLGKNGDGMTTPVFVCCLFRVCSHPPSPRHTSANTRSLALLWGHLWPLLAWQSSHWNWHYNISKF